MRLWSLHPCYLDTKGLVALWREGLLAQKVLQGETKGYKNHPQLIRFINTESPVGVIASYLRRVVDEADSRGYNFDRSKIANEVFEDRIAVTCGQLEYEMEHLLGKLKRRAPELHAQFSLVSRIKLHPMFIVINGDIETWEVVK